MSNCCCTNIGLYGSEHDLNELRTKLLSKGKRDIELYDFLSNEGIVSNTDKRETILDIGDISEAGDDYGMILECEDAWAPKIDAWNEYLAKYYPDVQVFFLAEEPGNLVFINTDDTGLFFEEKYYLDFCLPDRGEEEYVTERFINLCDLLNYLRPYGIIASSFSEAERIGNIIADGCESDDAFFTLGEYQSYE